MDKDLFNVSRSDEGMVVRLISSKVASILLQLDGSYLVTGDPKNPTAFTSLLEIGFFWRALSHPARVGVMGAYPVTQPAKGPGKKLAQRPLGSVQEACLRSLVTHGSWPGSGWVWSTQSATLRLLNQLVERGLAKAEPRPRKLPLYTPTDAGRALVAPKPKQPPEDSK